MRPCSHWFTHAATCCEVARTQNLEDLAPENAVASEIANIKQRLDEVHAYVRRGAKDEERSPDLRVLMSFVSSLAQDGRLNDDDLLQLFDFNTSRSFDTWVQELRVFVPNATKQEVDLNEEDFDDIPF